VAVGLLCKWRSSFCNAEKSSTGQASLSLGIAYRQASAGDVLLAVDHTGTGHEWRLINDEPWKRAYVIFKTGADTHFVPDPK
jgi:hypothetical protein